VVEGGSSVRVVAMVTQAKVERWVLEGESAVGYEMEDGRQSPDDGLLLP
jgi:hypothetical protein